jgi:hypothetical protein
LTGPSARERLEATRRTAETEVPADGPLVGIGWATVDLERGLTELATALGIVPGSFVLVRSSVALGARCLVARGALGGGVAAVILEPSTEGRLAGRLARHDEGPAVIWHRAAGTTRPGDPSPQTTPGPFGPERPLSPVPGRPELLRFIVDLPPGTIRA